MWKILLVIAFVVLGGAAWLSYDKLDTKKQRLTERDSTDKRLSDLTGRFNQTTEEITSLDQAIQMLETETETIQTEKTDLDLKITEAEAKQKAQEAALQTAQSDLDKAKELIRDIAEIEAIQREMSQIRTQIEEAEIELTQLEGAVAAAQVERDRLEKVAAELAALRTDQEAGMIRGEFQSQIKNAYNQWGFVVVAGGNDQGVVNRAQLDVYRRGQPICRLLVTSVEASESVADIVPGSLAPGQRVQVGDTVVKSVRVQTQAPAPGGAPAPSAGVPGTDAADGMVPDGDGMGTPADPFGGGMAPSSPAPPDPFGAPPADGGGMEGGGGAPPDPFGAPPADGGGMEGGGTPTNTPPDPFQ